MAEESIFLQFYISPWMTVKTLVGWLVPSRQSSVDITRSHIISNIALDYEIKNLLLNLLKGMAFYWKITSEAKVLLHSAGSPWLHAVGIDNSSRLIVKKQFYSSSVLFIGSSSSSRYRQKIKNITQKWIIKQRDLLLWGSPLTVSLLAICLKMAYVYSVVSSRRHTQY